MISDVVTVPNSRSMRDLPGRIANAAPVGSVGGWGHAAASSWLLVRRGEFDRFKSRLRRGPFLSRRLQALLARSGQVELLGAAVGRSRFATIGAEPLPSTPEEYAEDIDREETK